MKRKTLLLIICFWLFTGLTWGQQKTMSKDDYQTRMRTELRTAPETLHQKSDFVISDQFKDAEIYLTEDFEGAEFPPAGWSKIATHPNPTSNWQKVTDAGNSSAEVLYNDAQMMNEWIISPSINLSSMVSGFISFRFSTSYYWLVNPFDGADLMLKVSTDGGTNWTQIWVEEDFGTFASFTWYTVTLPFDAYAGEADVKIAFHYLGDDGAQTRVDDITVFSADVFELTMLDPVGEGSVVPAPGTYEFFEGSEVILAANPALGNTFSNWNLGDVDDANASITSIEMTGDKTVQATFTDFNLDLLWHQFDYGGNANNSAVIDENTEFEVADNFSSPAIESITKIFVQGLPSGIPLSGQRDFTLRFYAPTLSGEPDWENPVSTQSITSSAYFVEQLSWNPGFNVFKYELDLLEPVALQEGWISVQANDGGSFFWLRADEGTGDGNAWQRVVNPDGDPNNNLAYDFMLEIWGEEAGVAPICVAYLSPADEAVNQPLNTSLSWQASPNATGYTLYLGETLPETGIDVGNVTSYEPLLEYSTTYLWKVVPYNSYGPAEDCPVWSFTTGDDPTQFLPWSENFADIAVGAIPAGWSRTHTNWGAVASALAGGTAPEMRFNWTPSATAVFRLISPPLQSNAKAEYRLVFKHLIDYFAVPATYKVQFSNDGETWEDIWAVVNPAANVGPETITLNLGELDDTFYLAWVYDGNSFNTDGWFIDDIVVEEIPSAPVFSINPDPEDGQLNFGIVNIGEQSAPVNFTVTNSGGGVITINSVTITGEDAEEFLLTLDPEADTELSAGETLPFSIVFAPDREGEKTAQLTISYTTVTGLKSETYILVLLGNGVDPTIFPPFVVDFDPFPPADWTRPYGELTEETEFVTPVGQNWVGSNFGNNTANPKATKINLWVSGTSSIYRWFMSPPIDMSVKADELELVYDLAVTGWNNQTPNQLGAQDYFAVVVSLDGGETWSSENVIFELSGAEGDQIPAGGQTYVLDLSQLSGTIKLGFYAQRPTGTAPDIDLHLGNIQVRVKPIQPIFSINPESWDFGQVEVGIETPVKDFIITNAGGGLLKLDPEYIYLEGEDDYAFTLYNLDEIVTLGPGETAVLGVSFMPDDIRVFNVTLVIDEEGTKSINYIELTGEGFTRPAGSTCENPYLVTLPVIDYQGNTEAYGNDYLGSWIVPSSNYLNGYDFVAQFTLTEAGYLSGSVAGSWTGVIIVQDCPNPVNPAQRLALGSGSAGGSFSNVLLAEGTYFAIVSTFPTPLFTNFTLNLSFEPLPECPEPVSLTATDITTSSATLGWTAMGSETSWNVEWGLTGFTQGEGTLVEGVDNPYLLTGLNAATSYAFYVQAVCNGDNSDWAGPFTFATLCDVFAMIEEDFELPAFPPICWSLASGSGNWARTTLASGYGVGNASARANFFSISGSVPFDLITPEFDLSSARLTFDYAYATYNTEVDKLRIFYSEDGGATWEMLIELEGGVSGPLNTAGATTANFTPNAGQWATRYYDLPEGTNKVKFQAVSAWGNNLYLDNIVIDEAQPDGITLDLKIILEGAYSPDKSELMHTLINDVLPLEQPFAPALPYFGNSDPVWYYEGDESVAVMPDNAVDWVLVELRDAAAPSEAYNNTVVARQAALLLNTGEIVSTNLSLPVFDVEITEGLYVVIYHRNHLAVMSAEALTEEDGVHYWDFTQAMDKAYGLQSRSSYGNGHKELGDGVFGMFGGDGDANGQVNVQDKNNVWNPQSGSAGYNPADFDLNGQVNVQDKNNIWNTNTGNGSAVPGDAK